MTIPENKPLNHDQVIEHLVDNWCTVIDHGINQPLTVVFPDGKKLCFRSSLEWNTSELDFMINGSFGVRPESKECPHPEWLGDFIDRDGLRVRVTFDDLGWRREWPCGAFTYSQWSGPSCWKLLEPAPLESRAHVKPKETVKTPWDPYGGFYD